MNSMRKYLTTAIVCMAALVGGGVSATASTVSSSSDSTVSGTFMEDIPDVVDYIVVGGGTAGSVVAARLSEDPRKTVLLIDLGHDITQTDPHAGPVIFPGAAFVDTHGSNIIPVNTQETGQGSFPAHHYLIRAKALGGGSQLNGQCYSLLDMEDWNQVYNISGWQYEDMAPYQRKIETYKPWNPSAETLASRGTSGPVTVSSFKPSFMTQANLRTMSKVLNLPIGELNTGNGRGVSAYDRNSKPSPNWSRESSWSAYLKPVVASRRNLFIAMDSQAQTIVWKTRKVRGRDQLVRPLQAIGVNYVMHSLPQSTSMFTRVRGEVVLSAGALESAKILLLSGVGPAAHLADKDVKLALASEQVGMGMRDHISIPPFSFLVTERPEMKAQIGTYVQTLTAAFGSTGQQAHPFKDYEIGFFEYINGVPLGGGGDATAAVLAATPVLTRNSWNGTLTLLDNNPNSQAVIDLKSFKNPITDTMALAWIANATRTIGHSMPGFLQELTPGLDVVPLGASLAKWATSSVITSGTYSFTHTVGGCLIGTSIHNGVVDNRLKVFGTSNVRVADLSVLPETTGQRPFPTSMVIGERVSDFIKADDHDHE